MKRVLAGLFTGFLLGLTACLVILEAALAGLWLRMSLYVRQYGAAENPYAAEEAEIAGFCALALLPLALTALACAGCWIYWRKKRAKTRLKR